MGWFFLFIRFLMNHKYTLKKNHEIKRVFEKPSKSVGNKYYAMYCQESESTKVAIAVSKKLGTAVFRNHQKRVTREILRSKLELLRNKKILLVVKVNSVALSFEQKDQEITRLLKQIERN